MEDLRRKNVQSPNRQIAKSPNRQIAKSPNRQIAKSFFASTGYINNL